MDLTISNNRIIQLIKDNEPFIVSRIGSPELRTTLNYLLKDYVDKKESCVLSNNAGIYHNNNQEIIKFAKEYKECLKNSNFLAFIEGIFFSEQLILKKIYNLDLLKSKVLEPFYIMINNEIPWSHHLLGKKILIINPFVESFQKQLKNNWSFFENKSIFLPEQEFIFYKSYNTSAGNHLHSCWLETFTIMKNDIRKLDFDIALLGCGGYGLPLCNFIKTKLKKSAIYIGGGLQLLFGVKGNRWKNHPTISKLINDNGKFISPSGDEIIPKINRVEDGCYW